MLSKSIYESGVNRNIVFDLSSINLEKSSFTITGVEGFGVIHITSNESKKSTFRFYSDELEMCHFDIKKVSKEARDIAVYRIRKHGFSYSEIADILGLKISTVNNIIRRVK